MGKTDEKLLKELGFSIAENGNWIRKTDKGEEILVPQDNGTYIPYIRPTKFSLEDADDLRLPAIGIPGIIITQQNDINSVFSNMWEQLKLFNLF